MIVQLRFAIECLDSGQVYKWLSNEELLVEISNLNVHLHQKCQARWLPSLWQRYCYCSVMNDGNLALECRIVVVIYSSKYQHYCYHFRQAVEVVDIVVARYAVSVIAVLSMVWCVIFVAASYYVDLNDDAMYYCYCYFSIVM